MKIIEITQAVPAMFAALTALTMKTIITSNWRPMRRALCTLLIGIAAFWAAPRSARAQLYVVQFGNGAANSGRVGEYDAATGATINANFITGLDSPTALLLSGNTLFVANYDSGTVGEYNATTGAAINANFITGLMNYPWGVALSGNNLFVVNSGDTPGAGTVGEYNATTGAVIKANFITGLNSPGGLVVASASPTP